MGARPPNTLRADAACQTRRHPRSMVDCTMIVNTSKRKRTEAIKLKQKILQCAGPAKALSPIIYFIHL